MSYFWADWVAVSVSTTGTGGTLALGGAIGGFRDLVAAGAPDGAEIVYFISDGDDRERARGIFNAGLGTVTRVTLESTLPANAPINLSGAAKLYLAPSVNEIAFTPESQAYARRAARSAAIIFAS